MSAGNGAHSASVTMVAARILRVWRRYKYRFVPWIARDFNRQIERSALFEEEKINADRTKEQLLRVVAALHRFRPKAVVRDHANETTAAARWKARLFPSVEPAAADAVDSILIEHLGFYLRCLPSNLSPDAGLGVFVFRGQQDGDGDISSGPVAAAGDLIAIYPGTYYSPGEPLFWSSLGNPYIFRCADGTFLDGNFKGLSAPIFRSLLYRDSEPESDHVAADSTWMTSHPRRALLNPLAVGQFVNNATVKSGVTADDRRATQRPNVSYYELALKYPEEVSSGSLQFFPYLYYNSDAYFSMKIGERRFKVVALVATRDIFHGDELFSTYFTVVRH